MAKKASSVELLLPPRDASQAAYRWLSASLRAAILESRLRPGTRLPSTRELASQHKLSRGTIVAAFEQLRSEGYLEGTIGSGTYVTKVLPEAWLQVRTRAHAKPDVPRKRLARLSACAARTRLFEGYESRPTRAFRPNLPALDLFPMTLWTQIAARCLRNASVNLLMGCEPLGYFPLRQAVADYLNASRGVRCVPQQIAIVSGVQEALDLVGRLLIDTGDRVLIENPGYTGAALVFYAFGAKVKAIALDDEGIHLRSSKARDVRLIYVTPGHQFPLGVTMSLARRLQLLQWAQDSGALIFEDDYDSEFRYSGSPIPALQGLDRNQRVLYAGSFSKVLFPSLRLGYLVVPQSLVNAVEAVKSLTSRHAPLLDQAVLCDFITQGHFGRHLRRMRLIYAERLSVLLNEASHKLAGLLEISPVEAGLQTSAWLLNDIDGEAAAAAAKEHGVEVTPISRYALTPRQREGLQLGFAAVDTREIRHGVQNLAIALEKLARPQRGGAPVRLAKPSRAYRR
jgi:GntR family transcriptional regulator / MocR family aminotransferase